jgi:hypothetical protein
MGGGCSGALLVVESLNMTANLSEREVKFLLAWADNDGKRVEEIGRVAGLSDAASEVIAQKLNGLGFGMLGYEGFRLNAHGHDAIEQVRDALKNRHDQNHLRGL